MRACTALAIIAGLLTVVSGASAATTVTREPIGGAVFNSCTGELMEISGEFVAVSGSTIDASGGVHQGPMHVTIRATATGVISGDQFVDRATQTIIENFRNPGEVRTIIIKARFISPEAGGNLTFVMTFHATVTATGEVTAFRFDIDENCH